MHSIQSRESNDHRKWPAAGFVRTIVQSSLQQQKASEFNFWKSEKLILFSLSLINLSWFTKSDSNFELQVVVATGFMLSSTEMTNQFLVF